MAGLDRERHYGILDAERELIAAILQDNRAYRAISHLLVPDHFLSPDHRRQFVAIGRAIERGRPVDRSMAAECGHPLLGLPRIDPLDHALMIYGSYLGREAVGAATTDCSLDGARRS